jgi:sulfite reductase alpha subunit-like flavoprotein
MLSMMKIRTTLLLASALLLCSLPLAAALKTKPATSRLKAPRPASSVRRTSTTSSSRKSAKASAISSSRKSSRTSTAGRRRGKIQSVSVSVSKPKFRGQQSIDEARTIEIQQALIREHYLDGEATGVWDQATRDALTRFQSENGWQTKILPDSRALIKLGLGPRQQNLLNPESAAMAMPYQSGAEKSATGGSN